MLGAGWLRDRGSILSRSKRRLCSVSPDRLWGSTHPPVLWVPGDLLREVKRLITYVHLVPSSRNTWSSTFTPPYAFIAWCSVKCFDFTSILLRFANFMRFWVKRVEIWVVVLLIVIPCSLVAAAKTGTNVQHAPEMKAAGSKRHRLPSTDWRNV